MLHPPLPGVHQPLLNVCIPAQGKGSSAPRVGRSAQASQQLQRHPSRLQPATKPKAPGNAFLHWSSLIPPPPIPFSVCFPNTVIHTRFSLFPLPLTFSPCHLTVHHYSPLPDPSSLQTLSFPPSRSFAVCSHCDPSCFSPSSFLLLFSHSLPCPIPPPSHPFHPPPFSLFSQRRLKPLFIRPCSPLCFPLFSFPSHSAPPSLPVVSRAFKLPHLARHPVSSMIF